MVLVEVGRAVRDADFRQPSTPGLEPDQGVLPLEIRGVLGAAAWLDAFSDRFGVTVGSGLRAILAVRLFRTVAYFAHASVLPVNDALGARPLGEMRRKARPVMPAEQLTWRKWPLRSIWCPIGQCRLAQVDLDLLATRSRLRRAPETDVRHARLPSTGPYCMVAATMQLQRHGCRNHAVCTSRLGGEPG